jgi:uncharacterized protein YfaS (alpha-2-macroglobulin family)
MSEPANAPLSQAANDEKVTVTLPGTVEKVIPSLHPALPEKAQIAVQGADDLYKEIRIENKLVNEDGKEVKLKVGAEVKVTVEAPAEDTISEK